MPDLTKNWVGICPPCPKTGWAFAPPAHPVPLPLSNLYFFLFVYLDSEILFEKVPEPSYVCELCQAEFLTCVDLEIHEVGTHGAVLREGKICGKCDPILILIFIMVLSRGVFIFSWSPSGAWRVLIVKDHITAAYSENLS